MMLLCVAGSLVHNDVTVALFDKRVQFCLFAFRLALVQALIFSNSEKGIQTRLATSDGYLFGRCHDEINLQDSQLRLGYC